MRNNRQSAIVLSVFALALSGCSDSPPVPTAPTPAVPAPRTAPPPPTAGLVLTNVTLSGMVFEETATGRVPIDGVDVYCEPCGAETHTWAKTDSQGFYSFTGVWTDGHFPARIGIWVLKDGYTDPGGVSRPASPGWREVVVDGDTRFDMQLVRQ